MRPCDDTGAICPTEAGPTLLQPAGLVIPSEEIYGGSAKIAVPGEVDSGRVKKQ